MIPAIAASSLPVVVIHWGHPWADAHQNPSDTERRLSGSQKTFYCAQNIMGNRSFEFEFFVVFVALR